MGSSQFGLPPFLISGGGKREEEGEKERGAEPLFPFPSRLPSLGGGRHPLGAGVLPSYGPYGPYLPPGGSGNPSGTPVCTQYTPNPSGIRILPPNISIFTS